MHSAAESQIRCNTREKKLQGCIDNAEPAQKNDGRITKEFLSRLLQEAISDNKEEEATRIKGILRNELQKKIWATIHRELNQSCASTPTRIEVPMENGTVRECNTKEELKQGIGDEVLERFSRAASAPICQGALFDLLGYSADTEAVLEILAGTFVPPPVPLKRR